MENELFNFLLEKALKSYDQGLSTWNRIGLNYKQFSEEAKGLSISYLIQSLEQLNGIPKDSLSSVQEAFTSAYSLLVNSQVFFIRSSCESLETSEILENKYQLLNSSIELREEALRIFNSTEVAEKSFLAGLNLSILGNKGFSFQISARIQGRKGNIKEALGSYKQSEQIYTTLLQEYELETPALKQIQEKILSRINNKDIHHDEKEIDEISIAGYGLVFEDDFDDLPNLDVYRRTFANLYSAKANQAMIEAQAMALKHDSPDIIVERLETAINYIYTGMEFFPDQLDFHQDLFDAYHFKGLLFGCLIPQKANYYYFNCPLAIMRFVGHWYLSPSLRYKAMVCNICGKDILECRHSAGQIIDGVEVRFTKVGMQTEDICIVDVPRDPRCRIQEIIIPTKIMAPFEPKEKPLNEKDGLVCHLCDVTSKDLDIFPIFTSLGPEYEQKARKKFMNILRIDQEEEQPMP